MTREEVKAVAVTLREGDEVEVGMTYGAVERRATGTVYSVADHLYLFGVYITDGHLVSGALTYIRLIKKAPMPEPTLVGTVVITDSGYYVRVASGAVKKRWSGAVSANWSSLPNPRVATLAEIEAISRGEWVAR
jgi:hypothetical protein